MIDANHELTLTVTAAELNLIMAALGKLPYEAVAALIPKIGQQVSAAVPDAFAPAPIAANGIDKTA